MMNRYIRACGAAVLLALPLAGCEGPVDPAAVKLRYGGEVRAPDSVVVLPAWEGELRASPGEKVKLPFLIVDGVRDELFVEVGDGCAYVAGLTLYEGRGEGERAVDAGVPAPPAIDPVVTAATFKRVLPAQRTRKGVRTVPAAETYVPVDLAVALPKTPFDRAEVSVVFYLRGYARNSGGELRDTLVKKVSIVNAARDKQVPPVASTQH